MKTEKQPDVEALIAKLAEADGRTKEEYISGNLLIGFPYNGKHHKSIIVKALTVEEEEAVLSDGEIISMVQQRKLLGFASIAMIVGVPPSALTVEAVDKLLTRDLNIICERGDMVYTQIATFREAADVAEASGADTDKTGDTSSNS